MTRFKFASRLNERRKKALAAREADINKYLHQIKVETKRKHRLMVQFFERKLTIAQSEYDTLKARIR